MSMRLLVLLCSVLAVSHAWRREAPKGWRHHRFPPRPVRPNHAPSPLQKFLMDSTALSRNLNLKIARGIDPCLMSESNIYLRVAEGQKIKIGGLSDSFIVGLKGFNRFRQFSNIEKRQFVTFLTLNQLEGSSYVTLSDNEKFQVDTLLPKVLLKINSKFSISKDGIFVYNSTLTKMIKPHVLLTPPHIANRNIRIAVSESYIHSALSCFTKEFIPAFEQGINTALMKNSSQVINRIQGEAAILKEHYNAKIKDAAPRVIDHVKKIELPDIKLVEGNREFNLTNGVIGTMDPPVLEFVNKGKKQDSFNLEIIFPKLEFIYKNMGRPERSSFYDIHYLLQIIHPENSDIKILKGTIFGFHKQQLHRPRFIRKFNKKLMNLMVDVLQSRIQSAFNESL